MGYELIITEKPNAAKRIAEAISDTKVIKKSENGVPYYLISHNKKDIVVACAVGHLYTIAEKQDKSWTYPVFDVEWRPTSKVDKGATYTTKYLNTIKKLSKSAEEYTVATDYDIEGEVIGLNVLRFACKQKDAKRMKFSTLTKSDVNKAYENRQSHLDWGQANAGITRHELDWYYGINISRALMNSLRKVNYFKVMSSGRVQGPALKIIVEKEKEILNFKPKPFWVITLDGTLQDSKATIVGEKEKIFDKEKSEKIYNKIKDEKTAIIDSIKRREFKAEPPLPFDLTSFQIEAYKVLKIAPQRLLQLAQELYINGYISYPRTSSQKLPKEIDYKKILNDLKKNKTYENKASKILNLKELKPTEGKKTDAAHPAIYPTGVEPKALNKDTKRVYDLVVKRFLSCFSEPAIRETLTLNIKVKDENFVAKATRTKHQGWFEFYEPYIKLEEKEFPNTKEGEIVNVKKINYEEKQTSPPKRYTAASIIKELEKKNLGTKATRASIVEALYKRGYIDNKSVQATKLGIRTYEILSKYVPSILDEELTRHFEEEMDLIRANKKKNEEVLDEAKEVLTKILEEFKEKEKDIGKELKDANYETRVEQNFIGKCPNCDSGSLVMKKGKFGRFIACDQYPECKTTFKIPATGIIKGANKECPDCGYPMITITRKTKKGARSQTLCINPNCSSREIQDKELKKEVKEMQEGIIEKECPKCKKGKLVVRKSIYGSFLGCSNYPKCKYTEKIQDTPLKEDFNSKSKK